MDINSIARAVAGDLCTHMKPAYREALDTHFDAPLFGINEPLVLAHFLAQVFHETDGLAIVIENMSYTAKRMMQVWPSRFHTFASAKPYERNPEALANFTYGGRMGNRKPGDGFRYIGRGGSQLTGYESYAAAGQMLGVDFVANPDLVCTAPYILTTALFEWRQKGCTELAQRNDIVAITRRINGGLIGYDDRVDWFNRVWPLVQKYAGSDADASWAHAKPDGEMANIQAKLKAIGYDVDVDGRKGPQTIAAIKAFQKDHGLVVDGVCGRVTTAALDAAQAETKAARVDTPAPVNTVPPGIVGLTLSEAGQKVIENTQSLRDVADRMPYLSYALTAASIIAVCMIVWGLAAPALREKLRPGGPE